MDMGRRKEERQDDLFIPSDRLARSEGHTFYRKLNALLAEAGFDRFAEKLCEPAYKSAGPGRPSIAPGIYFRMLFVGYFEGIASQRGIAWRCNDSLALREFLGVLLTENTPDHSTLSVTRQRLTQEMHDRVFEFVLKLARDKRLLQPKTVGVDSTLLEANAAMKSIVRRDSGEEYKEYLTRLAKEAGIENPTDDDLRRFDRSRKGKRCSNKDWTSATDPEAEITKMKDGRTHLAYKAENAVDLESEFVLAAVITSATAGDAETMIDSVMTSQCHLDSAQTLTPQSRDEKAIDRATGTGPQIKQIAADKGYHKGATLEQADALGYRTYIPERKQKRNWKGKANRIKRAVLDNRRRVGRDKGKGFQRRRSEVVERSFAHLCETGGGRRPWLRGKEKIQKRYMMQAAARNLGLIMLKLFKIGKPRSLQDFNLALLRSIRRHFGLLWCPLTRPMIKRGLFSSRSLLAFGGSA